MNDLMEKLLNEKERADDIENAEKEDIKEWIQSVNNLYAEIEKWLGEEKKAGLVKIHTNKIYLLYTNIKGDYEITRLSLEFPGDYIFVEPIERYVLGAIGRIDIYKRKNPIKKFTLLRMEDDKKWYILERGYKNEYIPFDQNSFESLILELIR